MNWETLLKYINKESDANDVEQVENWLNEQSENAYLLSYLQKRSAQLQQPLKQTDIDRQWLLLLNRIFEAGTDTKPKSIKPLWLMGIAASLLLVSALGWLCLRSGKEVDNIREITLQTPANTRGKLLLPDSTEVFMAPGSKLVYNNAFGQRKRELHLIGEAFFSVKHNPEKPFIIHAENQLSLTVLGTSFNVYSRKGRNTEIKVATGLVGVTAANQTLFLKQGEQLSYQPGNKQITIKQVHLSDASSLQKETLFFHNDNADEIAEKLQRWYNIKVDVLPTARRHPRFSGEMKDTGIADLMKGLHYATGISYQYKTPNTLLLF